MIYFIQDEVTTHIKIGFTDHPPEDRVAQLQTGSPSKLVLLASCVGDRSTEDELHERFKDARVHGEWFRPVPALLQFIIAGSHAPPVDFIPTGDYEVVITESSVSAGNLNVVLQITSGVHAGKKVSDSVPIKNPNLKKERRGRATLQAICWAVGVLTPSDSSELHGKPFNVRIVANKVQAYS